jgi:hypothetical protein
MVVCIHDIRVQLSAGALLAEDVLFEIYSAIMKGLENILAHPTLEEMTALFTVSASGEGLPADVLAERFRVLGEWLATVDATASETETSRELVALELRPKGVVLCDDEPIEESFTSSDGEFLRIIAMIRVPPGGDHAPF